jgi:hypothetical protein
VGKQDCNETGACSGDPLVKTERASRVRAQAIVRLDPELSKTDCHRTLDTQKAESESTPV